MKQLSSMLSLLFAGLFWVFRVVLAYTTATGKDLGFPVQDFTTEVVLLFVVLILLVFVYKRNLIAGIILALSSAPDERTLLCFLVLVTLTVISSPREFSPIT